ncbi:DUF1186 domain-containing protein [Synechocystis salina LEGE 06155]|nr:DUF1186 domain-containing protein [Synechocystis salina LEGE 06155]
MMNVPEILQAIEYFSPEFPRDALEAASGQKEELTPMLLSKLEGWKGRFLDLPDNYYLQVYGFFLLAEFREKKAYPLIVDLMIEAGAKADVLFDEFITEHLPGVLASVYDGDLEPLLHLINTAADEYVRGSGIQALVILYLDGQLSREKLLTILEKMLRHFLQTEDEPDRVRNYLPGLIITECLDIHGIELKDLIDELFDADLVDNFFVNRYEVKEEFSKNTIEQSLASLRERKNHQLIDSTITEMENWFCFKSEEEQEKELTEMLAIQLAKYSAGKRRGAGHFGKQSHFSESSLAKTITNSKKKSKQKQQKLSRKKNRKKRIK